MDDPELDRAIAEKFLEWEKRNRQWWADRAGNVIVRIDLFSPTSSAAYCDLVLDEIERRGWRWVWRKSWVNWKFAIIKVGKSARAASDNRYRAVCEAALQAAETERQ